MATSNTTPGASYADVSSAILNAAGDIGIHLALWSARDASKPDAVARRAANEAMDAVDRALGELYRLRERLVSDIRASDDATAARADALLAAGRRDQRAAALAARMSRKDGAK